MNDYFLRWRYLRTHDLEESLKSYGISKDDVADLHEKMSEFNRMNDSLTNLLEKKRAEGSSFMNIVNKLKRIAEIAKNFSERLDVSKELSLLERVKSEDVKKLLVNKVLDKCLRVL